MSMTNKGPPVFFPPGTGPISHEVEENRIMKKIKQSPVLPVATVGFIGLAGYRIYNARNRGGMKISHYLIHTRLAAQGLAVAVLGSLVLYSLGERLYNNITKKSSEN